MSATQRILRVKPEYYKVIPRPSKERYQEIKKDILEKGQQLSIIVNQDYVILDGHTRYDICKELGIEPKIDIRKFENKLEEERFVYSLNVKRRDLPDFVHIELSFKINELDKKIAKTNQSNAGKGYRISDKVNVNEKVSKETGKHYDTVSKTRQIIEKASEKVKQDLRNGKDGVSINKVYKELKKKEKKEKLQSQIKKTQINLPELVQLYNKPFQELDIKDNSVSLIFTDPPYAEKDLYLYQDLAKQAARVLRDGGSLMCYAGHFCIDRIIDYMKAEGLKYHWIIAVEHSGPSASVFGKKILVAYKPILWFTKGKYEGEFVRDHIKSEFQGKELHEWAQSTTESDYYMKYLTMENEIIYDPFLGQGTFGISAVNLKRQFIGAEINPDHFENAKRLLTIANQS